MYHIFQLESRIVAVRSSRVSVTLLLVPNDVERTRQMQPPSTAHSDGHDRLFRLVKKRH